MNLQEGKHCLSINEQKHIPSKARLMAGLSRAHKKQAFRPVGVVKIDFSMIQVEPPQKPLTIQDTTLKPLRNH